MSPVDEAIEAAAREMIRREDGLAAERESYVRSVLPEATPVVRSVVAAFLRSIAGSPTPEMVEAGWRIAEAGGGVGREISASLTALADQVEGR